MQNIEPIISAWLVSPIGLLVTAVVIIIAVVAVISSLFKSYPSKE